MNATSGRTNTLRPATRLVLWARSAGRCQYQGCNKNLIGDLVSGNEDSNFGFVAHIVAAAPDGPRGDIHRSSALADDVANLMLLCHPHHKLIDVDEVAEHSEQRLLVMKASHEIRIDIVANISENRASHALCFASTIGKNEAVIRFDQIKNAMLPERYPAESRPITIEILGLTMQDSEPDYWPMQVSNLRRQFITHVQARIERREISHLSVFGLAPQPLLMELGRLLCDIVPADVFQPHREPKTWRWAEDKLPVTYRIARPASRVEPPALVFGLSAAITDDRVRDVIGPDVAIWSISTDNPNNDIMRRRSDLSVFRTTARSLLNEIKEAHGENAEISIFPAMPASVAVELGRIWMPKADLPLMIYDQNRSSGGFCKVHEIR